MMHHERFLMQSDHFLDYPERLSGGLWWGIENAAEVIMAENSPNLKEITYSGTGSTEDPKQVELKETHTKRKHN